jgi:hypothetical protein
MTVTVEQYNRLTRRHAEHAAQIVGSPVTYRDFLARLQGVMSMNTMYAHFDIIPYLWQSCKT